MAKNKDLEYYKNLGDFNEDQLGEINYGLEQGLDVSIYAKPEFDYDQMIEIRWGIEDGVDVSKYAKPEFTWEQMNRIREAMVNFSPDFEWAKPEFSVEQMELLEEAQENCVDCPELYNPELSLEQMEEIMWVINDFDLDSENKAEELGIDFSTQKGYFKLQQIKEKKINEIINNKNSKNKDKGRER